MMTQQPIYTLQNGQESFSLSPDNRGLSFGDGLFETMLVEKSNITFWQLHLKRLQKGLSILGIGCDLDLILSSIKQCLQQTATDQRYILKLIIVREAQGRGYLSSATDSQIIAILTPYQQNLKAQQGVSVHRCREKIAEPISWAGCKTLNQLSYVLASQERLDTSFDEGLIQNSSGFYIEATARNMFLIHDDKFMTPKLEQSGVAGVMRHFLIDILMPKLNLNCIEAALSDKDIMSADGLFLCNSISDIWPVLCYESKQWENHLYIGHLQQAVKEFRENDRSLSFYSE